MVKGLIVEVEVYTREAFCWLCERDSQYIAYGTTVRSEHLVCLIKSLKIKKQTIDSLPLLWCKGQQKAPTLLLLYINILFSASQIYDDL